MIPSVTYGLIYTVPFKSIKDNSFLIEIYKRDYTGTSTELIGSVSPFVITIEDADFIYEPLRFSNAKLTLVGNDYLRGLFSVDYQQYKVVLKSDKIIWSGFIKPEIYSQDYTDIDFTLELECISGLSSLEFIDYPQQGVDGKEFVSIWNLIKLCIGYAYSDYTGIVLPHVYASNAEAYTNKVNVLNEMLISEQNFFDEDGVPMNLKDVLEEVCKFLNWTCADWKGKVYFNDPDWTGEYLEYTPDFSSYTILAPNEINVQANGFAGADHTLDILGGYNKVSVKTSNYNVGEIFPEEEYDSLSIKQTKDYTATYVYYPGEENKVSRKLFLEPKIFKPHRYIVDYYQSTNPNTGNGYNPVFKEYEGEAIDDINNLYGAQLIKRCEYELKDGVPQIENYTFEDIIQIRVRGADPNRSTFMGSMEMPLMEFSNKLPVAAYSNGAIAFNMHAQIYANQHTQMIFPRAVDSLALAAGDNLYAESILRIGNLYWNGSSWVSSIATFKVFFEESELKSGNFTPLKSNKTLSMPYNGLTGHIIPLPEGVTAGELQYKLIKMYAVSNILGAYSWFIKDFSLKYQLVDGYNVDADSDRIYENVVNESYVNELDEIENKISTYNYDDLSYSKVLLSGDFLTDNLYSALKAGNVRLEEQLITRIINRYSQPSIKLKQILSLSDNITPLTRMTDNYLSGKKFIVTGGSINIEAESFETQMIEVL